MTKSARCIQSIGPLLIIFAALIAYHNSFSGAFLFDDIGSIRNNPSIRRLWPIGKVLSPPTDQTVGGRPIVNLSLAINYAFGGLNVRGYHIFNLTIHILAALLLFGIIRRTFLQPRLKEHFGRVALPLSLTAVLLWTVHPLQTESVTYIIQRSESLGSFFYLATLYSALRGTTEGRSFLWSAAAFVACLLGVASKEIVFSAPLLVLLYERTFRADSFREAWRRRRGFYLWLGSSWLVLAYQVSLTEHRGRSVIFEFSAKWINYVLTQFVAVARYLRLAVWPSPLVIDYGYTLSQGLEIFFSAGLVLLLLALTLVALRKWPSIGFTGAFFTAILATSSSIIPIRTQPIAEHRMYLPLASLIVLTVTLAYRVWKMIPGWERKRLGYRFIPFVLIASILTAFIYLTIRRNEDYRSGVAMWRDAVQKRHDNPRAHNNLAEELLQEGKISEAINHYQIALSLKPDLFTVHNGLGNALSAAGRHGEALMAYQRATALNPNYLESRVGTAFALLKMGRAREAITHFEWLVGMQPDDALARFNLSTAQLEIGDLSNAITQLQSAIRLQPDFVKAYNNLGHALKLSNKAVEALTILEKGLRIAPNDYFLRYNQAISLMMVGRKAEAKEQLLTAMNLAMAKGDGNSVQTIRSQLDQIE